MKLESKIEFVTRGFVYMSRHVIVEHNLKTCDTFGNFWSLNIGTIARQFQLWFSVVAERNAFVFNQVTFLYGSFQMTTVDNAITACIWNLSVCVCFRGRGTGCVCAYVCVCVCTCVCVCVCLWLQKSVFVNQYLHWHEGMPYCLKFLSTYSLPLNVHSTSIVYLPLGNIWLSLHLIMPFEPLGMTFFDPCAGT